MNDKPHKNLIAWERSMDLVVGIYEIAKRFRWSEAIERTLRHVQGNQLKI
jgi:hypothetical protein